MEKLNQCPVCKSAEINSYIQATDHTVSGEKFNIDQCINCGLRFTNPRPDKDEIQQYYESEDYISHTDSKTGFLNTLYQNVKKITLRQKTGLVKGLSVANPIHLLDYGCGTGDFLVATRSSGFISAGVEPSDAARKRAEDKNLKVMDYSGFFRVQKEQFDVITLWHVLEHVHELERVFTQLLFVLKPKGKLIIALPNSNATDANIYHEHWAAFDVPRHLYHFTPISFQNFINLYPLQLIKKKHMPFDPFYIALLSEKYKTGSANYLHSMYHGLISFISGFKETNKASSIIYILEKE